MRYVMISLALLLLGCIGAAQEEAPEAPAENATEPEETGTAPDETVEEPAVVKEPAATCSDDDGQDIYTQGTVTAFEAVFQDICEGEFVKEYYCEEGEAKASLDECPPDFKCQNGRCIKGRRECADTDGGNNIYEEGTVTIEGLIKATYIDKCTSTTRLKEYYCQDDELVVREVECETQCKQARCLE